jgi:hypothetical protein
LLSLAQPVENLQQYCSIALSIVRYKCSAYHQQEKIYITLSLIRVNYITPNLNLSSGLYHLLNFPKPDKLSPEAVLKNHSKSQKNHKMEKQVVLGSKWVALHNEHNVVWFSTFFTAMKKSIDLKLQQKIYNKHTTQCLLCRTTHSKSNTIGFFILRFFRDLLWFFKIDLGVIWPVLESLGGNTNRFIGWGLCSLPLIGDGVI